MHTAEIIRITSYLFPFFAPWLKTCGGFAMANVRIPEFEFDNLVDEGFTRRHSEEHGNAVQTY
jgi:hypothetical protein